MPLLDIGLGLGHCGRGKERGLFPAFAENSASLKSRASVGMSGFLPAERARVGKSKSFRLDAKATQYVSNLFKVTNGLAMACRMLYQGQTKWRATGYSEKTSARGRSECPLHYRFVEFTPRA